MVCCVLNCPNKSKEKCRSFAIPAIDYKSPDMTMLSKKRRKEWVAMLRLNNSVPNLPSNPRICSKHFIKGRPSKLENVKDPDWVPSQNLGKMNGNRKLVRPKKTISAAKNDCGESLEVSENESFGGDAKELDEPTIEFVSVANEPAANSFKVIPYERESKVPEIVPMAADPSGNNLSPADELQKLKSELKIKEDIIKKYEATAKRNEAKYKAANSELEKKCNAKELEIKNLQLKLHSHRLSFDSLQVDDERVKQLTGLPNFLTLSKLYEVVRDKITAETQNITKFDFFVITLMKLRLDLPISFLSFTYGLSYARMSKMYREILYTMNEKIGPLVKWPDDETMLSSIPQSFKKIMGNKCIVLIHFFDMHIRNLKSPLTGVSSFNHTIRYLIAFTPLGEIIYVSQGFGSCSTNEHIIETSDFLDKINENYIYLTVKEMFTEKHKKDLKIQKIKHLAKHTEDRMLELLRDNFRILFNRQAVQSNKEVYSEYTVRCCCALANLQMPETSDIVVTQEGATEVATVVVHAKTASHSEMILS